MPKLADNPRPKGRIARPKAAKAPFALERPAPEAPATDQGARVIRRQVFILAAIAGLAAASWGTWKLGQEYGWGDPDRAMRHKMEQAQQALVERRLPDTIQYYVQAIERHPGHALVNQAEMGLAAAYEETGQVSKAVETYGRLLARIQADPAKSDLKAFTQLQIAKLHAKQGAVDQALKEFAEVRKGWPGSDWAGEAMEGIGKAWQGRKEWDKAIEAYQKLIKEYPKGFLAAAAQSSIGECYESQEKFDQALKAYKAVLDGYPSAVWDDARQKLEALQAKMKGSHGGDDENRNPG